MNWQGWLAVLLVALALAGCAQGTTNQTGAAYAPYAPENNGNMHDSGGGEAVVVAYSPRKAQGNRGCFPK